MITPHHDLLREQAVPRGGARITGLQLLDCGETAGCNTVTREGKRCIVQFETRWQAVHVVV